MTSLRDLPAQLTRIVTCYRQWHYLALWVDHDELFCPGVRWIVVNDAPDDPCPAELLAKLASKEVKIITPAWNLGRSNARNRAAASVETVWLEHIDGDDMPLPIAPEALSSAGDAGLILFPIAEHRDEDPPPPRAATARPWKMNTETYWGFLVPSLRPFDPRPASTVWRTDSFRQLGGYDARFDGNEDLHLFWKADVARITARRWDIPKQWYRVHGFIDVRTRREYMESLRFYLWIRARCRPEQQRPMDLLIGRQILACARLFVRDVWSFRHQAGAYLRARFSGEFLKTYR